MIIDHPIRPKSIITTGFGHDIDPVVGGYRFHRAIDRSRGDRKVYCPMAAIRAVIENPSTPSYGTLIRLIYDGFEIRLAHCVDFDPYFVSLVSSERHIPAGTFLAAEGKAGKATGPHTHIELIAIGDRSADLDASLKAHGGTPGERWSPQELQIATGGAHVTWMQEYGARHLGPYECVAWDRRTNSLSIWMDPAATLGL